jgi:hypothetical protein
MNRFEFDEDIIVIPPPTDGILDVVVHVPVQQDFKGRLTTWDAVRAFLWGGNAVFTLRSTKTGMRYTYQVKAKKDDVVAKRADVTYFVALLRGPDNIGDWKYVGVLRKPAQFNTTSKSKVHKTAESVKALLWFLDKMAHERDVLNGQLEFWHEGRCCVCGRKLTVPESIASGRGPVCDEKERL